MVTQSYDEAITWFERAARQGHDEAKEQLTATKSKALSALINADEAGDANASLQLCFAYEKGLYGPRDISNAGAALQRAAERGNLDALEMVGNACWRGTSQFSQDYGRAISYYEKVLEKGFNKVVLAKLERVIEEQEFAERIAKLKTSFEEGNLTDCLQLGMLYNEGGPGMPANKQEALNVFEEGSEFGNALCSEKAGDMYLTGDGVEQSFISAIHSFVDSIEQGNKGAIVKLKKVAAELNSSKMDPVEKSTLLVLVMDHLIIGCE